MQELSHQVKTGLGANALLDVGRAMKALGFPQSVLDGVANGQLSASQQFAKYSIPNMMGLLKSSIGAQSRILQMEFLAFQKANPNLESDPDAIQKMLGFAQHVTQLKLAEQKGFRKWVNAGRNPSDYQTNWIQHLAKVGELQPEEIPNGGQ